MSRNNTLPDGLDLWEGEDGIVTILPDDDWERVYDVFGIFKGWKKRSLSTGVKDVRN